MARLKKRSRSEEETIAEDYLKVPSPSHWPQEKEKGRVGICLHRSERELGIECASTQKYICALNPKLKNTFAPLLSLLQAIHQRHEEWLCPQGASPHPPPPPHFAQGSALILLLAETM